MEISELIALQSIKGIGNKTLLEIIKFLDLKGRSSFNQRDLDEFPSNKVLNRAVKPLAEFFLKQNFQNLVDSCQTQISKWEEAGISIIPHNSEDYPPKLKALDDPPALLFCLGNLSLLKESKSIAVVGTRDNTRLGEVITRKTVEHFAGKGFCIVSGLALGIDAIAHKTALSNDAPTIAVLVDIINIYPSNHRELAAQILAKNGLLLSENPPLTSGIPALFAKRDRIQAGVSVAVFAIETSIDGGTMHAVKAALSMNRPVFVPDAIAAGYADLTIKAISGTQQLVNDQKGTPYTSESYAKICDQLGEIAAQFRADC